MEGTVTIELSELDKLRDSAKKCKKVRAVGI